MSLLLLVFAVLGVYYPAIFSPLNSIDDPGMYSYLLNMDDFNLRGIFFPGGSGSYYRPLLVMSYMMDKYVWGLEESFMHLENIVFHLCNTLLVFAIARRAVMIQRPNPGLAPLAAALLFALHPLHTEVVNWIAGRTDLLAAFFLFLSFYLLLNDNRSCTSVFLSAFSMFVACLAKETAIFFLPAALLLPFYVEKNGTKPASLLEVLRGNWQHFLLFLVSGAAYFFFRTLAFSRGDDGVKQVFIHVAGDKSTDIMPTLITVLKAAGFYLKKLVIPFPLNFGIMQVSDLYAIVGALLVFVIAWLVFRRTLPAFFAVCAFSVGSSALLIPLIRQTWTPLAERYMYIPSAFFLVGLTLAATKLEKKCYDQRIVIAIVCVVIALATYGTARRTLVWQDNLSLFQDTLRKSPGFVPAQNEIANALYARGRIREASAIITSIQLPAGLKNRQYGFLSKAAVAKNNGDYAEARNLLNEALKDPGKQEDKLLLKVLQLYDLEMMAGKVKHDRVYPEMLRVLSRLYSVTSDPYYQYRLGQIYMRQNERKLAHTAFSKAANQAPSNAYYRQAAFKLAEKMK